MPVGDDVDPPAGDSDERGAPSHPLINTLDFDGVPGPSGFRDKSR